MKLKQTKPHLISLALAFLAVVIAGCSDSSDPGNSSGDGGADNFRLVATTGHINNALQRITDGTDAEITLFCGPGVDPHSFSASTNHVQTMLDSDLIIYNGFHLEAKLSEHLHDTFEDKSWAMSSAFPEDQRLDWVEDGQIDDEAPFDPHIWNNLPAWAVCVEGLADRLAEADPDNADTYRSNAEEYVTEINEAHEWAREQLSTLPEDRRVLVSAHDAFNYFANNYNLEPLAVLGIGNDAEADIRKMREVAETICDKKIPAIFLESITNAKVTEALSEACDQRGWTVEIVEQPLYSDDLGEKEPYDTFLGAFRANVELIVTSLSQ
ncbi:MAG: zinc ABC transporter substrate-binding protein [Planctomycetota bacterium]